MRPRSASCGPAARFATVCALALALSACSLPKPEALVPTTYDLGPPRAYTASNPDIAGTILLPAVAAPAWLDEAGIVYRLLYEERDRPQRYTMSRWIAEPAALLTDRLRSRFAAIARGAVTPLHGVRSDYTLRVDLEDFSQVFEAPGLSHVSLRARATLLGSVDRKLIGQRGFEVRRPAAPDAPGAVKALSEAADNFVEEVARWAMQSVGAPGAATKSAAEKK